MLTLVVGGAASGKSEYAEELILRLGEMPRYYIATMQPFDEETAARIVKHQRMRAGKRFETIECYTDLASVHLPQRGAVLLECMSNLAANERYSPAGAGENAHRAILEGVAALERQCEHLVIVSNEVFSGGQNYAGDTDAYLRLLAGINRAIAARADRVVEIAHEIPYDYKAQSP
jgi:adenosylcobinamide kinase/adenosylcobinamide-phosphate guanylyltransferase